MIAILDYEIEESPHSAELDAGQHPGRGNLPDRATETDRQSGLAHSGKGEKVGSRQSYC